jgi:hypothetical protein
MCIPINNTTLDMFRMNQQIIIQTTNGEELKSRVHMIRCIHPLGRNEVILQLDKPYTLYRRDDSSDFNGDKDPTSVTATHPSIRVNRTVLYYHPSNQYMFPMVRSNGYFHSFISSVRIII